MEEMQKMQLEEMRKMAEQGRMAAANNPWDTEFKRDKAKGDQSEALVDKAKSFSF